MLVIHPSAVPILVGNQPVGWQVENKDFTLQAVLQNDGTIKTYVEWGDDMGGDLANFKSWPDVKSYLDTLLQSSRR